MSKLLNKLPSPAELLESPQLRTVLDRVNRNVVTKTVRSFLEDMGRELKTKTAAHFPSVSEMADQIVQQILGSSEIVRPVINGTGIVIHNRLGSPPLAEKGLQAAYLASIDYENQRDARSLRTKNIESLLKKLSGAESALVVNSLPAAVLLAASALAKERDVLIARDSLVEIDNFRIHEVLASSGANLCEVGTANCTRAEDFQKKICESTGLLIQVETFFSGSATANKDSEDSRSESDSAGLPLAELIAIGKQAGVPVVDVAMALSVVDFSSFGLVNVPRITDPIAAGADVVLCSGDKFIGGPQSGILVGRRDLIERMRTHPLAGTMQLDKLSLVVLETTLQLSTQAEHYRHLPLLELLERPLANLKQRAERLAALIAASESVATAEVVQCSAKLALQPLPEVAIPSLAIAVVPRGGDANSLAERLASGPAPLVAELAKGEVRLNLRTIFPRHDSAVVQAFERLCPTQSSENS